MYAQNVLDKPDNWTYEALRDVYVQIAHTETTVKHRLDGGLEAIHHRIPHPGGLRCA